MAACVEFVAPAVVEQTLSKAVDPVKVAELAGVDAALERALRRRGVVRVEQLRRLPKPVLMAAFGDAIGRELWASVRGLNWAKRTFWTRMRADVGRVRHWLATAPKPAKTALG